MEKILEDNQIEFSSSFYGVISALHLYKTFLFIGNGNFLKIVNANNPSNVLFHQKVFQSNKITKIQVSEISYKYYNLLILIAEKEVKFSFIRLDDDELFIEKFHHIMTNYEGYIVESNFHKNDKGDFQLILGYVNNYIEIYKMTLISNFIASCDFLKRIFCPEKCIVYSMKIFVEINNEMIIASGTVFRNIIIWRVNQSNESIYINFNLKGHEGVVFNLNFLDKNNLLSVSDDRTLRHWIIDYDKMSYITNVYIGHTGRVWDSCGDLQLNKLVSVSEDCSARVYDIKNQKLIKELFGAHMGKNIRCVQMNKEYIFTAAEDGQLIKWNINSLSENHIIEDSKEDLKELFTLNPNDESVTKAKLKQKNFSVCVKFLKLIKRKKKISLLIGTNHGDVIKQNIDKPQKNKKLFVDPKQRVINSILHISEDNLDNILLIGLCDGEVAIIDMMIKDTSNNYFIVKIFNNIRIAFSNFKIFDDLLFLIFANPIGVNKIFIVNLSNNDPYKSIINTLEDKYEINNMTIKTGAKNPLQVCSSELIRVSEFEYLIFFGDFGGNIYFTLIKVIDNKPYNFCDITFLNIHKEEKVSYIKYTGDYSLYTCGRDGTSKKFKISLEYNYTLNSNYYTIYEMDCKMRNDIASFEYFFQHQNKI